jgi:hypothetical protein
MSEYLSFYGEGGDWDNLRDYGSASSSSTNTTSSGDATTTGVEYIQAISGFFMVLLVYFCMIGNMWLTDASITKEEVQRSIVHKRVLSHGQSHCFDCNDAAKKDRKSCQSCGSSVAQFCCSIKKRTQRVLPAFTEDGNRCVQEIATSQSNHANTVDADTDTEQHQCGDALTALDQAEQGIVALDQEITCPICLEQILLGEEVAWSKLRHCKHFFHFECITHWLMQGHMQCPVCRDRYWNRSYRKNHVCTKIIHKKESDPIDDMDARRFNFCELHGLTWPEESNTGDVEI